MDRTRQAVEAQLRAMGTARFEVGVFSRAPGAEAIAARLRDGGAGRPLANAQAERLARATIQESAHQPLEGVALAETARRIQQASARMRLLPRTTEQIVGEVPWLRGQNARGQEIYIRSLESSGLILVDDLTARAVAQMRYNGATPAVVAETSPGNYQAWIRLAPGPIPEAVATAAARALARQYGGDPASAHWRHMGRLAGFTNQKPSRTITDGPYQGRQPFVLLREAAGRIAPAGPALLVRAHEQLARELTARESIHSAPHPGFLPGRTFAERAGAPTEAGRLAALYHERAAWLGQRTFGEPLGGDLSRLDWAVARDLARRGHAPEVVAGAVRVGSPRLEERKAGHVDEYVARTVSKVFAQAPARKEMGERAPPREDGTWGW